jgi:polyhydroxybutyrate depolymerase
MSKRVRVLATILLLLLAPAALAAFQAFSFYVIKGPTDYMISSGEKRDYTRYVPSSYDPSQPTPLVISMHGAGLWGRAQMEISRWNEVADKHGFIVVYPSGWKHSGPRIWRVFPGQVDRDVRFISELIDILQAHYNIDPARVYANGLSNGGGMAFALSCMLHDRIAAVGLIASAQTMEWGTCTREKPVPVIAIHGTADQAAPYHGRTSWVSSRRPFPHLPNFMATWAGRNRCAQRPVESRVAADVVRRAYVNCAHGADVEFYTVERGGHTWPGGGRMPYWMAGRMSNSISASQMMWEFFQAHPLDGK